MAEKTPVLVVDDSPVIRKNISEILTAHGFDVTSVGSGMEAVAAIKQKKFHLVTLDVEMPGMAGIDVLRIVKIYDPDLFVIMVSGLSALQTALHAIRQGAYDYINKPFDPEDMVLSVLRALRQRNLIIENRKLIADLQSLNQNLEGLVKQRTEELQKAHEELLENHEALETAYSKLKELDELKVKFMAIASHELRTPLTTIQGFAELLVGNRIASPDGQKRALDSIGKNVDRLASIVGEITDIAKLREKKLYFHREPVDLGRLIQSVVAEMLPLSEQRSQSLTTRVNPEVPQIDTDPHRMRQVITHMILNSIRFTPDQGKIEITLTRENQNARVTVSDTGIGVAENQRDKIFEEFYEAAPYQHHHSGTIQFQSGGIGLGLSVVKGIIEELGGKIWVESPGADKGSTFHFTLPL